MNNIEQDDSTWNQEPEVNINNLIFSNGEIIEYTYVPYVEPADAWWGVAYEDLIDPGFIPSRPPFGDLTNITNFEPP
jgi:hypothetical protein